MLKIYKCVFLEKYANFKGRARRKEFWIFCLTNWLLYFVLSFLLNLISIDASLLLNLFLLFVLLPSISVAVRRMHDIHKAWWYILIPFYNIYLFTVMGDAGGNKYGADPIDESEYLRELGKDLN